MLTFTHCLRDPEYPRIWLVILKAKAVQKFRNTEDDSLSCNDKP